MSTPSGSRRPADTAFKQQRLRAWQPILTPKWVISSFFAVGVAFIGIAIGILGASNQVQELSLQYDAKCENHFMSWNASSYSECILNFTLPSNDKWATSEVYVYYELSNFYQNHRKYVQSRAAKQLAGTSMPGFPDSSKTQPSDLAKASISECQGFADKFQDPQDASKELYMYPCGLVAVSMFNDTFYLQNAATKDFVDWNPDNTACNNNGRPCPTNPSGIAWKSDVDKKYIAPKRDWILSNCKYIGGNDFTLSGFDPNLKDSISPTSDNCGGYRCGHRVKDASGLPNQGSFFCWHNVSDEDFIVWMRVAALPRFKKLYRKIPANKLKPGATYSLIIQNRFPVKDFGGTKTFVLSTTSWIGGKNNFLGIAYIVVGIICVALAIIFLVKHLISPRILGDPRYLNWK